MLISILVLSGRRQHFLGNRFHTDLLDHWLISFGDKRHYGGNLRHVQNGGTKAAKKVLQKADGLCRTTAGFKDVLRTENTELRSPENDVVRVYLKGPAKQYLPLDNKFSLWTSYQRARR